MDYLQYRNYNTVGADIINIVLNLVINGLPSILKEVYEMVLRYVQSFKPCYKWITFNTSDEDIKEMKDLWVLNLVINGLPSILHISSVFFLFFLF